MQASDVDVSGDDAEEGRTLRLLETGWEMLLEQGHGGGSRRSRGRSPQAVATKRGRCGAGRGGGRPLVRRLAVMIGGRYPCMTPRTNSADRRRAVVGCRQRRQCEQQQQHLRRCII